jgi:tetrahedral aminopeptidase
MKQLLEELSNAPGISGHECGVRKLIMTELKAYVDEMYTDNMGNLITRKSFNATGPTIMLAAHMDEIGLTVRYIDADGFIFFNQIGGWFDQTLLNQRMIIHTRDEKEYYGIIGSKPPHVMKIEEYSKVIKTDDMFLDVGAGSKAEVEKMGIEIGNQIVPDAKFFTLNGTKVSGKALDNRAGCAMLIEAIKRLKNTKANVYAVFTVQEEVGLKGARTAAYKINPDFAFATDVTICGDHPSISLKDANVMMGKGPAVMVSDGCGRGIIVPEVILNHVRDVVNEYNIPVQYEAGNGGTTDGAAIQLTRDGIPTGVISVPTRYIHTPYSVMDMTDLESSINLIVKMLESW